MTTVIDKVAGSTLHGGHTRACTKINTAVKAADSRSVNWTARGDFKKYCAAFGD